MRHNTCRESAGSHKQKGNYILYDNKQNSLAVNISDKENTAVKEILNAKRAYTHSGVFHLDDLFGAITVKLINPKIEIIRVNKVPEDPEGIAFDIGGGKYDHHLDPVPKRDDGMPYAAFGLLFRALHRCFMDDRHYYLFDECFIKEIDLCDNTNNMNPLSVALLKFNGIWNAEEDKDALFFDTMDKLTPGFILMVKSFASGCSIRHSIYIDQYIDDVLYGIAKNHGEARPDFGQDAK